MRTDIQFMRGLAVLLVVCFHADISFFSYGYLGVDVFFVISGFLITGIILKDLYANTFSFSLFYLRRAKRLLPALYSTLFFTSFFCLFFLSSQQWSEYIDQLIGAITFSANMVLPTQIGYFDGNAESKPLLHIWSLSLEEQYYFFLPLVLFLIPAKLHLKMILLLAGLSLFWCMLWVSNPEEQAPILWRISDSNKLDWAFYLLPTRAWELLVGSLCAWYMLNKPDINIPKKVKYLAFTAIIFASMIEIDSIHPRGDAFVVVLATALILLGKDNWLPKWFITRWIKIIGDSSYSIYLVHWPLFVFAYLGYVEQVPFVIKIVLIFASLGLGFLQYRYVETPFRLQQHRHVQINWKTIIIYSLGIIAIPIAAAQINLNSNEVNYSKIRQANIGLSVHCTQRLANAAPHKECYSGDNANIVVWGDSYAMHLIPGIKTINPNIIQITKNACGPFIGLSHTNGYSLEWAKKCIRFNNDAMNFILNSEQIKTVILSSSLHQYFNSVNKSYLLLNEEIEEMPHYLIDAAIKTIKQLQASGKKVIFVSPPPRSGFNIGECSERKARGLVTFKNSCDIKFSSYILHDHQSISFLDEVAAQTDIKIIRLDNYLCSKEICKSFINDTILYRDNGHLTITGSMALFDTYLREQL